MRQCFELAGVVLLLLDPEGKIRSINTCGCHTLGFEADELRGQDWFDTCLPEGIRREQRHVFNRLLTGVVKPERTYENPIRCRSGRLRTLAWHNVVICDDRGRPTGVLYSGNDVTEQRQTEQALRESAMRLSAVFDTVVDGIITIDECGVIASFNPAAERIFGYESNEVIGKNVNVLMPGPYQQEHDKYLSRYRDTAERRIIGIGREVMGRRKNGSTFPLELSVGECSLSTGRLFTGIVRDISVRKRDERRILELQREVASRSADEQQRLGRDLHDGLGQELTNIAFRASVLKQMLERKSAAAEAGCASELVELSNQAIGHLRALVRGLCPVVLHEKEGLAHALADLAVSVSKLRNVECRFEYPQPVELTDSNSTVQLYFIASEAINNATRHGEPSEVLIRLHAGSERGVVLTVEDDGSGFDAHELESNGLGFRTMEYRARMISAKLTVSSRTGAGTLVSCVVPADTPQPSNA